MSMLYQSSPIMTSTSSSDLALDSPSRQLLRELRLLQIHDRRSFYEKLDEQDHDRALEHSAGLAAAAAKHEHVRRDAEEMLKQYHIQLERQRRRQEEERRQREETIARERREKQEREEQERRRQEEAEKAKAEAAAKEAAEEEAAAKAKASVEAAERERQEAKRREDEENARKKLEEEQTAREAIDAEEKARAEKENAQKATIQSPQPQAGPVSRSVSDDQQVRYLGVHRKLKELRAYMNYQSERIDKGKKAIRHYHDGSEVEEVVLESRNPPLHAAMAEGRRVIRKSVGQLNDFKGMNAQPKENLFNALRKASQLQGLGIKTVNPVEYLAHPPPELANSHHEAPALFIYLLNLFAKYAIAQWATESGVETRTADPLGVLVVQVFSSPDFKYQGKYAMIDILLAKFRVVCPVLWGINGDEKTPAGKKRIGWHYDKGEGHFVSEQRHSERMTGLGAGFASIALRNFSKSPSTSPVPNSTYWTALANIVNLSPKDVRVTHFMVLKSMIEGHEEKFLEYFGTAGRVALRKALLEFPSKAPEQTSYSRALALLPEVLARDKNIHL